MGVSTVNLLIIAGAMVVALALVLAALRIVRWRRDLALRRHTVPALIMPLMATDVPMTRPPALREVQPSPHRSPPSIRQVPPTARAVTEAEEDDVILVADEPMTQRPTQPMESITQEVPHGGHVVAGSQVRYYRAEEGTLEFLPGRLEVVGGTDVGQEIHFMRRVGEESTTVTFGRSEGPPLRHVQLIDPTVSRQHARLSYSAGRWHLANLSQTNPVTLNGVALPPSGRALTLQEGDRLEMGAVVFVYHEH
jgi:FHA domain